MEIISSGNLYIFIRSNNHAGTAAKNATLGPWQESNLRRSNQLRYRGQLSSSDHAQVHVWYDSASSHIDTSSCIKPYKTGRER